MSDNLKPCPFCGGNNLEMRDPHGAFSRLAAVYCDDCEIKGPLESNAKLAADAWNNRVEAFGAVGEVE